MVALAGKPALEPPVEPDPPLDPESAARPQPVRARAATAVTPTTLAMRRICMFPFCSRPGGTRVRGCGEEPGQLRWPRVSSSFSISEAAVGASTASPSDPLDRRLRMNKPLMDGLPCDLL